MVDIFTVVCLSVSLLLLVFKVVLVKLSLLLLLLQLLKYVCNSDSARHQDLVVPGC